MSISKQEIEAEALGAWLTFEGLVSKVDCQVLAPSCDSKAKCLSVVRDALDDVCESLQDLKRALDKYER